MATRQFMHMLLREKGERCARSYCSKGRYFVENRQAICDWLRRIKRLNAHLANPDYIVPGMEIYLPATAAVKKR